MKYKAPQKRRPVAERRRTTTNFFSPEKFIAATPAHIHTDEKAQAMAESFNARAFTFNDHIFFNKNEYNPGTNAGRKLLVHELAHVRQNRPVIARAPKPDPAAEARLKAEEKARLDKVKAEFHAQSVLWGDIHTFFPEDGRKLAGTGYDDTIDLLNTSFKEGDEKQGNIMVHHSAPVIYVGKNYVSKADPDKRKAAIEVEIGKIDDWRFDTYRIDDKDVTNTKITGKISALDLNAKSAYITQLQTKQDVIANKNMQEFIRKQMPSTPIGAGANLTADGGFTYQFDNVTINVLTDVFNDSSVSDNGGETRFRPVSGNTYPGTPAWKGKGGKVTEITNPPAKVFPVWTVQTFYGPNAAPSGPSGYGYGTRSQDKAPGGNNTLRFHEGSHGASFVEYIRSHIGSVPYPTYTGAVGDTTAEIAKKHAAFEAARDAFKKMIDDANRKAQISIDCAGKTIVQYHTEHGTHTDVKCP